MAGIGIGDVQRVEVDASAPSHLGELFRQRRRTGDVGSQRWPQRAVSTPASRWVPAIGPMVGDQTQSCARANLEQPDGATGRQARERWDERGQPSDLVGLRRLL